MLLRRKTLTPRCELRTLSLPLEQAEKFLGGWFDGELNDASEANNVARVVSASPRASCERRNLHDLTSEWNVARLYGPGHATAQESAIGTLNHAATLALEALVSNVQLAISQTDPLPTCSVRCLDPLPCPVLASPYWRHAITDYGGDLPLFLLLPLVRSFSLAGESAVGYPHRWRLTHGRDDEMGEG